MNPIDVSVIIVNYNTSRLCLDCVNSILKFETNKDIEFIIVDNASETAEVDLLKKNFQEFPAVKLVFSKLNLGFSGGNMLGFQTANGKYLAFINSDVLFVEPVFETLIAHHQKNPKTGVCSPQILDENHRETISFRPFEGVRYKLFGKKFLSFTQPKKPKMWEKQTAPVAVDFTIGSFMFFKMEAFCEVGGFDTNIFLYYEETDICYRLKQKGYNTFFLPHLSYLHLEGKSGGFNVLKKKEHLISYLYVTRKNFRWFKFFIIKNYLLLAYFFKAVFKKKHRPIFSFLLKRGESLAHSLKHSQSLKH